MEKYIEQLEQTFSSCKFDNLTNASKEEKLLALYAFYNFYRADTSSLMELFSSFVYEAGSKDHIDGIFIDDEADKETVELVSSFYLLDGLEFIGIEQLNDFFNQMFSSALDAVHKASTTRSKLIYFFSQDDDYLFGENKKNLCLNIITNYSPKSDVKRKYLSKINKIKINSYTTCKITFGQEIEQGVLEIESPKEYVDHGFLIMDKENNCLKFGYENSLIINVSAKSLKQLYNQYSNQGLFAQNLRYYIKEAKRDSKIIQSIQNKGENFWYYNNGIILICDNYSIVGKSILLDKFSIINGGQTTKLIGDTEFDDDFYIQCKIIRNKYNNEIEKSTFISEVAEASNTQKPIKDKDLIANRIEQKLLKTKMANVGVYVQIKRGSVINKKVYPESWQNTTNEELGQFIYSFFYQCPGSARNNKSAITGNKERYEKIFAKDYNAYLLRDFCYFKSLYKNWLKIITKNNYEDSSHRLDPYMKGLTVNGTMIFLATLGAIAKLTFNMFYKEKLKSIYGFSEKINLLSQYDLSHNIFRENILSYSQDFYSFLNFIYVKYIREGFQEAREEDVSISFSNFLKTDKNYRRYVLKNILREFDENDLKYTKNLFSNISQEQLEENKKIFDDYYIQTETPSLTFDDLSIEEKELYDKLKKYRTVTYNFKKIKAYDVFKNDSMIIMIKNMPKTISQLVDLNCLTEKQLMDYGEDILSVINGSFNKFSLS